MITCSICNTINHHLSVICSSCGGFIQNKIDNLDLFSTAWKIIESPIKAFRQIAIAEHKNYVLFLCGMAGIALIFFVFWIIKAGEYSESLLNILVAGFVVGPFLGLFTVLLFSTVHLAIIKIFGFKVKFKNIFAVTAYALGPIVLSVIIFLPIEIITFGIFFFSANPSPYSLKPMSYCTLVGLDGLSALWTIILLLCGTRALLEAKWLNVILTVSTSLIILSVIYFWFLTSFIPSY
jgi:hypothetical protein